ncbi:tRNA-Thr(GGU) m(6)t(6)A37 methyltransferase TsaA [Rhodopseudomonas julia]|uniref:tRNA-Thr(GGU) m(6)t(6)A37 methyltransferase TsaA n=1 Tax=Rhodopseudomonas julia TaxID=200617 RepID=A0ABU0C9M6_9BRAD|nr:TrmO family methyltransferase [Rhodopseudomonas julia]MDQ0326634.1 tRNA-Thr(GGU) m(6)t(6)A37 methyltransferase TsaA [Rhodopseudomonas julia]
MAEDRTDFGPAGSGSRQEKPDVGARSWENPTREGEIALGFDPGKQAPDAGVVYIGHARTPWTERGECPRNIRQARERAESEPHLRFFLQIDEPYRPGLADYRPGQAAFVLMWMDGARRDLIVQAPKHRERPAGVFSLRSPVRPNPIGLSLVSIAEVDQESGVILVDALDCLDGTPIIDLKPWTQTADIPAAR